ncbi:MAG: hypothetical protein ACD_73C00177G0001 [uncultured bacterium]|nr:MAG: hypothetical protein ACD_73C00177G0001 [uncultured bacterium]
MRAIKFLGICWGLAIFSVFIPLAHFILVPGFFLGGIAGCAFYYQQQNQNLGGTGTCPDCKQFFKIEKSALTWPLEDVCAHCHVHVKIEKS